MRWPPPTRASSSCTVQVKPFGGSHLATAAGSRNARYTRDGGGTKTRWRRMVLPDMAGSFVDDGKNDERAPRKSTVRAQQRATWNLRASALQPEASWPASRNGKHDVRLFTTRQEALFQHRTAAIPRQLPAAPAAFLHCASSFPCP